MEFYNFVKLHNGGLPTPTCLGLKGLVVVVVVAKWRIVGKSYVLIKTLVDCFNLMQVICSLGSVL
jgi:hypothetical protein